MQETEIQSGRHTKVVHIQVGDGEKGAILGDYISEKRPEYKPEEWANRIKDGFVTVDCEVMTDPTTPLDTDFFIEYVEHVSHKAVQTDRRTAADNESVRVDHEKLASFLRRAEKALESALSSNETSKAFDGADFGSSFSEDGHDKIVYWKQFTVDLEKKKVVYPDWIQARYVPGVIIQCLVTRNKERIYDIEYEDGAVLTGVKEEYIRLLDDPTDTMGSRGSKHPGASKRAAGSGSITGASLTNRLQEGMRVHAKVLLRSGAMKYLPGRVVKVGRSLFDVECEGNRVETGLSVNDLCIGLSEGQHVEARKPIKTLLQGTGISWNATGSLVGMTFGRHDISGWCEYPGALCIWNVFVSSKHNGSSAATSDGSVFSQPPDHVLDHPSCLTCVAFHPLIPSIVAIGSFNGEVVLWDLTNTDRALQTSAIIDYAHKEPVVQVHWIYHAGDSQSLSSWYLVSIGGDGRVLFWSMMNKLQHPVRGFVVSRGGAKATRSSLSSVGGEESGSGARGGRHLAMSHGASASAVSFTSNASSRPTWLVLGQDGGTILRTQLQALLTAERGRQLTPELLRTLPPIEDVFPSLKQLAGATGAFQQPQPHIGSVTSIDWSPFHRNLYITAGSDGVVKLFHTLQPLPLRKFEPAATVAYQLPTSVSGQGVDGDDVRGGGGGRHGSRSKGHSDLDSNSMTGLVSVTAVKFSAIRPSVFAVATSDGRIFLYDLYQAPAASGASVSSLLPVQVLYVTSHMLSEEQQQQQSNASTSGDSRSSVHRSSTKQTSSQAQQPVCVTSLAFNGKRRDVLGATDWLGRLHLWKLSASLCTRRRDELAQWERLGRIRDDDGDNIANADGAVAAGVSVASAKNEGEDRQSGHKSTTRRQDDDEYA